MKKLIGYARVSTRGQQADRQIEDLVAAGVRRDDLYVDHGVSGARTYRPGFDQALAALQSGDTLVIATLDRLGRSTQSMLTFAQQLRERGAGLRVLNLGGGDVDTSTPNGVNGVHGDGRVSPDGIGHQARTDHRFGGQAPSRWQRSRRPTPSLHRQSDPERDETH